MKVLNLIYKNKTSIKLIATILVLVLSVYFFSKHYQIFLNLKINLIDFFWLSFFTLSGFILNGYIYKILIEKFGVKLNFNEWFGLTIINRLGNYLFLKGGPVLRGLYLKKIHNFSFRKFVFILFIASLVNMSCASIFSMLAVLIGFFQNSGNIILFAIYFLLSLIFILALNTRSFWFSKLLLISNQQNFKQTTSLDNKSILIIATNFMLFLVLYSAKIFYIFNYIFNSSIKLTSAMVIAASGILSSFISLTPGSLGIKEMVMSQISVFVGGEFVLTTAVATIDRAVLIIYVFTLGAIYSFWFSKKLNKKNDI